MSKRLCRRCRVLVRSEDWVAHLQAHRNEGKASSSERGYNHKGGPYERVRREMARTVASGLARCSRCGEQLNPADSWEPDHVDGDKTRFLGPAHTSCNRAAGARAASRPA